MKTQKLQAKTGNVVMLNGDFDNSYDLDYTLADKQGGRSVCDLPA